MTTVLLLHGILMPAISMSACAARLRRAGFSTQTHGYWGATGDPIQERARLRTALAQVDAVLAHSLGGLMALQTLAESPEIQGLRIVCLGSPLAGSQAARQAVRWRMPSMCGRVLPLLASGVGVLPETHEVGSIAGTMPLGIGGWLGQFEGDNDGTVGVEETRMAGLVDHATLPVSHMGLILATPPVDAAARFFQTGRFAP